MASPQNTAPGDPGPMEHQTPPIDVEAELDRPRVPEQSDASHDPFAGTDHEGHGHTNAGVAAKVMTVRTIGEFAGMGLAWILSMKIMNELFEKSTMALKDSVSQKYILPHIGRIEGLVQKYVPGIAGEKLIDARKTGDAAKVARTYAPYLTDIPVALTASFGGKVWAQEELNKRLDVPLDTHENLTSAFIDNGVQFGSFVYLASPAGRAPKAALSRMIGKVITPFVKQEQKVIDYADYGASLQVPNFVAFGASSAYLLRQALDGKDDPKYQK